MFEVIAAIVGVALGAIVTWWFNRTRPLIILCEDSFKARLEIGGKLWDWSSSWRSGKEQSLVSFGIGIPETKMLFRGTPINTLSVLRLKFRNAGHTIINNPRIVICLDESATILRCDSHLEPEPIDSQNMTLKEVGKFEEGTATPETIHFEKNRIELALNDLYPFRITRDVAVVDIFCDGEIGDIRVTGRGALQNGLIWAVRFESWIESKNRLDRNLNLFGHIGLLGLLITIGCYVVLNPPHNLIEINSISWKQWIDSPWFVVIIIWFLLLLMFGVYMAMAGYSYTIRIPFTKRRIVIGFQRILTKK